MASQLIAGGETTFILTFFEEFYARVAHYKVYINNRRWLTDGDETLQDDAEVTLELKLAHKIGTELKEILDRQAFDAPRFGGEFAAQYYREAQYIMVSLADEVFLNLDWKGGDYWEDHLLESAFFGTHAAGEIFFKKLDEFLVTRDPVRKDIGQLYLLALGLGFLGQYRDKNDQGRLNSYKRQLYVFAYHQEPRLFDEEGEKLFPQAYAHTLKHGQPRALHEYKPWIIMYVVAFLTLTLISMLVWHSSTRDLEQSIRKILMVKERLQGRQPS